MTYEESIERLVEAFPELAGAYETERQWWGDEQPGPHVVYGDVFNPFLDNALDRGDFPTAVRIFDFLEQLATAEDSRVEELLGATILEHLRDNPARLRKARCRMRPATFTLSLLVAPPEA